MAFLICRAGGFFLFMYTRWETGLFGIIGANEKQDGFKSDLKIMIPRGVGGFFNTGDGRTLLETEKRNLNGLLLARR